VAYPARPSFVSPTDGDAYWKVNNALSSTSYICATNGPGFITEVKRRMLQMQDPNGANAQWIAGNGSAAGLVLGASGLLVRALFSQVVDSVSKPNATGTIRLSSANLGAVEMAGLARINTRWTEATVALLAAWFRRANGGEETGSTYAALIQNMTPWSRDVHLQMRNEFDQHVIGRVTLQVAAWFVSIQRDFEARGRLGGGGPSSIGPQFSDYRDIDVDGNALTPPWDTDIAGTPAPMICRQVSAPGHLAPTVTYRSQATGLSGIVPRGLSMAGWAKLGVALAAGGVAGYMLQAAFVRPRRRKK
jgi:hypothetical protein